MWKCGVLESMKYDTCKAAVSSKMRPSVGKCLPSVALDTFQEQTYICDHIDSHKKFSEPSAIS